MAIKFPMSAGFPQTAKNCSRTFNIETFWQLTFFGLFLIYGIHLLNSIALDISVAFTKVCHSAILNKRSTYGLLPHLWSWIISHDSISSPHPYTVILMIVFFMLVSKIRDIHQYLIWQICVDLRLISIWRFPKKLDWGYENVVTLNVKKPQKNIAPTYRRISVPTPNVLNSREEQFNSWFNLSK